MADGSVAGQGVTATRIAIRSQFADDVDFAKRSQWRQQYRPESAFLRNEANLRECANEKTNPLRKAMGKERSGWYEHASDYRKANRRPRGVWP